MYTNKQLAAFCLEMVRSWVRAEVLLPSQCATFVWKMVLFPFVGEKCGTALHEAGHGLRLRAAYRDGAYAFMHDSKAKDPTEKNENFFVFLLLEFIESGRAACYPLSEEQEAGLRSVNRDGEKSKDFRSYHEKDIAFSAGGINNNTYLSELISNQIFLQEDVSCPEGFSYFTNQAYGAHYAGDAKEPGDDPWNLKLDYAALGIPATLADMERAGWASVALSGTTYYIAYSAWNALWGKEQPVQHFAFLGIRVPDTFSYLTTKGVSLRTISEYNVREHLDLTFGAEYIVYGHSATEFHIGVKQTLGETWNSMSYACSFTFGLGLDAEASVKVPISRVLGLSQDMVLGADVGVYSRKSLLGERHSPNLRKDYGANFSVSVSWMY
jgi:hypothetical protein